MNCRNIMLVLLGLLLVSGFGFSATIFVNGTDTQAPNCGGFDSRGYANYTTISDAISFASAGDQIIICKKDGGYFENIVVNKSLNITTPNNGSAATLYALNTKLPAINITANWTNISFLHISGAGVNEVVGAPPAGIRINASHINISNVNISNCTYGVYLDVTLEHVEFRDSTRPLYNYFYNNRVYNNSIGFYLAGNGTFVNNTVFDNWLYGFYINGTASYSTFINNTGYNYTEAGNTSGQLAGFQVEGASYLNFTNNTAYNNNVGFNISTSNYLNLSNNTGYNNTYYNFGFSGSSANLSHNNVTNISRGVGYQFDTRSNVSFAQNNYVWNRTAIGIDINISGGSAVTTYFNSIFNNLTTTNGSIFFDAAKELQIVVFSPSSSGALQDTTCADSASRNNCTRVTYYNKDYVNLTANSVAPSILLGLYYNTSTDATTSDLAIGRIGLYITSGSAWEHLGVDTLDTSRGTVRKVLTSPEVNTSSMTYGISNLILLSTSWVSSPSTTSTKSFTLSKEFDCNTGKLTVETGGVSYVDVSLVETSPIYVLISMETTTADGVEFTITQSGTYKLLAARSGYYSEQIVDMDLTLCSEPTPQTTPECTTDSDCLNSETCIGGSCAAVTGVCGYASDHEWVAYDCCMDSDCLSGYSCVSHECVSVVSELEQQAREALENANAKIAMAKAEGKDVSGAEAKYMEAELLFQGNDYESAVSVSTLSVSLIKDKPKASSVPPKTTTTTTTPTTPANQELPKQDMGGLILMLGAGVVLLVVLVGAYFVMKGKKK
ncbi:MAG: hypothetical protein ABII22_02155 [Candidatus Micrarchaeota archaeon]